MLAKDKVCSSLDVGFCVDLSTGLSENGVLETEEFAGVVALVLFEMVLAKRKSGDGKMGVSYSS
jgi:hypothetical protein